MKEITLSLMFHTEQSLSIVRSMLDEFEKQAHIHVSLNILKWETGYSELSQDAIYDRGPDVSEVGTTWISSLVAMNALRPYTASELAKIGEPEDFIPALWDMGHEPGDERMWAVPYTGNIQLIYYRKDLLQKAGLDETSAFQSHGQIAETVKRLAQCGVEMPLVLPNHLHALLHTLASWVWAQGGNFCTPDGKQVLFDEPKSLAAIRAYFGLLRSLSPDALKKAGQETSFDLFCRGEAAIHFHHLAIMANEQAMLPHVAENCGIVPFPKPYFIGGTNLVVWQHSSQVEAAVELVQFLTSAESMAQIVSPFQVFPPRLEVMSTLEFLADPLLKTLGDVASAGRSYPAVKLWGMIEKRLIDVLLDLRSTALADPSANLDALIDQRITTLAHRLNIALSQ